jgi:hypothetical protein
VLSWLDVAAGLAERLELDEQEQLGAAAVVVSAA